MINFEINSEENNSGKIFRQGLENILTPKTIKRYVSCRSVVKQLGFKDIAIECKMMCVYEHEEILKYSLLGLGGALILGLLGLLSHFIYVKTRIQVPDPNILQLVDGIWMYGGKEWILEGYRERRGSIYFWFKELED